MKSCAHEWKVKIPMMGFTELEVNLFKQIDFLLKTAKRKKGRLRVWNRDINASRNILQLWKLRREGLEFPLNFKRATEIVASPVVRPVVIQ